MLVTVFLFYLHPRESSSFSFIPHRCFPSIKQLSRCVSRVIAVFSSTDGSATCVSFHHLLKDSSPKVATKPKSSLRHGLYCFQRTKGSRPQKGLQWSSEPNFKLDNIETKGLSGHCVLFHNHVSFTNQVEVGWTFQRRRIFILFGLDD